MERDVQRESSFVSRFITHDLSVMLESTHMYIGGLFHSLQMSKPKSFLSMGHS